MIRLGKARAMLFLLPALAGTTYLSAETQSSTPTPDFKEVYDLIRDHLSGISEVELNRAAVQGLLSSLGGRVSLASDPANAAPAADTLLVSKTSLFDGPIGYVRLARVAQGLDQAVREAWDELAKTNRLAGLILDARYADGTDYAAAVATTELFIKKEQPLLDWGQGMVRSKDQPELKTIPLAVLVNRQTAAAPEALAAVLRSAGAALILGSRTAGQAMIAQDYPLKDGERLRIATAPIQLGDGSSLSGDGLKPDISVAVNAADERAYFGDAFKEIAKAGIGQLPAGTNSLGTNRVRRPRFNEAELVRERRDGTFSEGDASNNASDGEKPVVRDPVLARALDFLKGLSVIRQTRS